MSLVVVGEPAPGVFLGLLKNLVVVYLATVDPVGAYFRQRQLPRRLSVLPVLLALKLLILYLEEVQELLLCLSPLEVLEEFLVVGDLLVGWG